MNYVPVENEAAEQSISKSSSVALGKYSFDPGAGRLRGPSGTVVRLGHQATEVLKILAQRPGMTVSKDEIFSAVWGDLHVSENSLSQCVMQIRRAIEDRHCRIVGTVPKIGYRLNPEGAGVQPSKIDAPTVLSWRLTGSLGLIAILVAIGFFNLPAAWLAPQSAIPERSSTDPQPQAIAGQASIAVLPFEDMTGEARWKRLAEGLAIGLSGELARHPGLQVLANTSLGAERLNESLSATTDGGTVLVLDGSLQEQDGQLRLMARLSNMSDAKVIWTETWDGAATDIFEWQDEIYVRVASSIAAVWTGAISKDVLSRTRKRSTENLDAYELFLLGSAAKHTFTEEGLRQATEYLEKAVAIDPDYARAWVALDLARLYLSYFAATREEGQAIYAKSVEARKEAYAADPNDPEVLIRYSGMIANKGDLTAASAMLRRGVEGAPSDADILSMAAFSAAWRGVAGPEPVAWAERSLFLNKKPPSWYLAAHGMALFHDGQFAEAARVLSTVEPMKNDALMVQAAAEALSGELNLAESSAARLREVAPTMAAMDLVPTENHAEMETWQAFLQGARQAGIPIGTPRWVEN